MHFPPGSTIPFQGIEFAFEARFLSTVFEGDATFSGTDFKRCVTFYRATFHRLADLRNATFENSAVFYETSFEGEARFSSSVFHGFAHFSLDRETRPLKSTFLKYADFRGTHFEKRAIFSGATFEGNVDFHDTCLSNATFENTIFQRSANFTRAEFNGTRRRTTDFRRATFGGELYFREAEFNGYTDFYRATFLDTVRFVGRESKNDEPSAMFPFRGRVSFMRARAEKPELVSFDSVKLRPSWFIGVDTRKFNFTAVEWHGWKSATARETEGALRAELSALDEQNVPQANERLARTCRELSMNYEENRDYAIAGHFHHWSMKAGQKSIWEGGFLAGAYGLLSGHGENPKLTFRILLGMWIAFALLYAFFGLSNLRAFNGPLSWNVIALGCHALLYSAGVMTRLRTDFESPIASLDEPYKSIIWFLVTVQGILGPLQIALFILAVRRKLMR